MNPMLILQPVACMFLLTGVVWLMVFVRRMPYIARNHIDAQALATPEQLNALLPPHINSPSNNLKNLCELPVIFYALCGALFMTSAVDSLYLKAAWIFVGFRVVHSIIHMTVNIVNFRFLAYFISSIALWFMVIRFALAVLR